ncbi:MAG: NAD(P)-dependent alcohol dehydrogenase [Planctomycetota bacterium]
MPTTVHAHAAPSAGAPFEPLEYDLPDELGHEDVEIAVTSCGICHSDQSMHDNEWGMTAYPFVGGHEVVGRVERIGEHVTMVAPGDTVGLGWFSGSCTTCAECMRGDHNLCSTAEGTIVGRHGGFADRVRCRQEWAAKLPDGVDAGKAGPLFCGGITVFNPIVQAGVRPTDRVGVVGIGGLGHLAIKFLSKWGCHVTAFTSSDVKAAEAKSLGATDTLNSRDPDAIRKAEGTFDFLVNTAPANLDWDAYVSALAPRGTLISVGVPDQPIAVQVFPLILGQRSIGGSPLGSPATIATMLDFCARHQIEATTEHFPMAKINDAFEHLRAGKARYRIVLDN